MLSLRRFLPLFLILAASLSPVSGAEASPAIPISGTARDCMASLASPPVEGDEGDEGVDRTGAAVECLIAESAARSDTAFKPLFSGLFNGAVMAVNLPGQPGSLVLPGDAIETDEGSFHTVRLALPYTGRDVAGPDGKALLVPADSLIDPDIGRAERALLQPVLTGFDLLSPEPAARRSAASLLGETRDLTRLQALHKAYAAEGNPHVAHVMRESIARLELRSEDPARRLAAAVTLEEIRGVNALGDLRELADPEGEAKADPALRAACAAAVKGIESWITLTGMLQNVFSGLSLGSILILMALGLAVIFGLMGVINMAHGEFMMIGAYATFLVQVGFETWFPGASGWFLAFSFPVAFFTAGAAGMLIEATIIKRLYGRPLETLLATWGVSLLLIQIARTLFGDLTAVSTPPFLGHGWEVFPGVVFPYNRLFIIVLTAVIVTGMTLLFFRTSLGMKVRAVTQNRAMSACLGVRTRRLDNITFGIGTGIAGVAGCALTQIGNVDPGMGQNYIVDSFMVVVTGGVGKLMGAVFSGLGIGVLNKFLEPYFQAVYAKVILLGLVILFLQWRPSGLFPAKGRHEDN
jgi:urea transport system permease protein